MSSAPIVWTPHASVAGVYWSQAGGLLMHVKQTAENEWRGLWYFIADPPGAIREMATHASRRAAMDWCVHQAAPERVTADLMHLIGSTP